MTCSRGVGSADVGPGYLPHSCQLSGQGWCGHPGGTQEHPGTHLDLPTPQQSLLDLRIDVVKLLWVVGGCCGEWD